MLQFDPIGIGFHDPMMHRSLLVVGVLWSLCSFGSSASGQPAQPAPASQASQAALPMIEITATRVEVGGSPSLSTDLLFEPGDAAIKAAARPLLDAIARALAKDPTTAIIVGGYTDDTAPDNDRSGAYNLKLSRDRAEAVAGYLARHGVAAKRMTARGHGRDKPVADNATDDGKQKNRRIELAIVNEVRPPDAADLALYTRPIRGTGSLIATLVTSLGTIRCQLFDDKAPATVANFIGLATGQKPWTDPRTGKTVKNRPFYDGLVFHRVIPRFMIQGGDPLGIGTGGPGYAFGDEISEDLAHKPGALAMANAGPGTNGSQFFIDEVDNASLNRRYTVFGQCKEVDVVSKIAAVPRGRTDKPEEPVTIQRVTITRGAL
jgi:peptidyl-prolyl cis-trans isomerase A (cyclophilin A)